MQRQKPEQAVIKYAAGIVPAWVGSAPQSDSWVQRQEMCPPRITNPDISVRRGLSSHLSLSSDDQQWQLLFVALRKQDNRELIGKSCLKRKQLKTLFGLFRLNPQSIIKTQF